MRYLFLAIVVVAVLGGCGDDDVAAPEENWVEYQISVERIEVPPSIAITDTLEVKLYGTIGADSGHRFDRMETTETESLFELTAIGLRETSGAAVIGVVTEWRGQSFYKSPPHASEVRVVFNQPHGTTVEKLVSVEQ